MLEGTGTDWTHVDGDDGASNDVVARGALSHEPLRTVIHAKDLPEVPCERCGAMDRPWHMQRVDGLLTCETCRLESKKLVVTKRRLALWIAGGVIVFLLLATGLGALSYNAYRRSPRHSLDRLRLAVAGRDEATVRLYLDEAVFQEEFETRARASRSSIPLLYVAMGAAANGIVEARVTAESDTTATAEATARTPGTDGQTVETRVVYAMEKRTDASGERWVILRVLNLPEILAAIEASR